MRRWVLVAAPLALAAVAAAAYYGTAPQGGKVACPAASAAVADRVRPLAKGEIAALAVPKTPSLATALIWRTRSTTCCG